MKEFEADFVGAGQGQNPFGKDILNSGAWELPSTSSQLMMMRDDEIIERSSIFYSGENDDSFARSFHYHDDCNSSGRHRGLFF